jgi:hypothetical protein
MTASNNSHVKDIDSVYVPLCIRYRTSLWLTIDNSRVRGAVKRGAALGRSAHNNVDHHVTATPA